MNTRGVPRIVRILLPTLPGLSFPTAADPRIAFHGALHGRSDGARAVVRRWTDAMFPPAPDTAR